jgi:hypothetical protein
MNRLPKNLLGHLAADDSGDRKGDDNNRPAGRNTRISKSQQWRKQ